MLEIASDKVAHIIIKAREYDAKVGSWDDSARAGDAEEDPASILEDYPTIRRAPSLPVSSTRSTTTSRPIWWR
jgi:hypothetical protein